MLRRLVDASYDSGRDRAGNPAEVDFWLSELRSPEFLIDAVQRFPAAAARATRTAVTAARDGGDIGSALAAEQVQEMVLDRAYWDPLRRELEALRHAARRIS